VSADRPDPAATGARDAPAAARRLLAAAERVVILTGAGLSADSGLRTFRDRDGHWRNHRPEDLATPAAFERDPCLVWSWYSARREAVGAATPNPAHLAIARFALTRPGVSIITQNVDALHTRAAEHVAAEDAGKMRCAADASPLELHGCLFRTRCTRCAHRHDDRDAVDASAPDTLPRCPQCGALLRPDVVWFGESLGAGIERAFQLGATAQVCLVVGTSAVVQPAASVALITRRAGGAIIEINPEETPLTPLAEISLRATAVEAVPGLLRATR
jgi:NAD-dependent deacetylase